MKIYEANSSKIHDMASEDCISSCIATDIRRRKYSVICHSDGNGSRGASSYTSMHNFYDGKGNKKSTGIAISTYIKTKELRDRLATYITLSESISIKKLKQLFISFVEKCQRDIILDIAMCMECIIVAPFQNKLYYICAGDCGFAVVDLKRNNIKRHQSTKVESLYLTNGLVQGCPYTVMNGRKSYPDIESLIDYGTLHLPSSYAIATYSDGLMFNTYIAADILLKSNHINDCTFIHDNTYINRFKKYIAVIEDDFMQNKSKCIEMHRLNQNSCVFNIHPSQLMDVLMCGLDDPLKAVHKIMNIALKTRRSDSLKAKNDDISVCIMYHI
jgi:ribosomal protein S17E